MKFRIRCVVTGKGATAATSIESAERWAIREGFVKIDGKWYWDTKTKEKADADRRDRHGNNGPQPTLSRNSAASDSAIDA